MNNYEALMRLNEHMVVLAQRQLRLHLVVMLALAFQV